jgi:hypothetical protein
MLILCSFADLETAKLDWETQKKSQHRAAEKERRAALTAALEQLSVATSDSCCALPSSSTVAKQSPEVTLAAWTSKIRTVQYAIAYIRCLQQHVRDLNRRLDAAERQHGCGCERDKSH